MNRKLILLILSFSCLILVLTGCTSGSRTIQPQSQTESPPPQGYVTVQFTQEQHQTITKAAVNLKLNTIYVPRFIAEDLFLKDVITHDNTQMLTLVFEDKSGEKSIMINESNKQVFLDGVVVKEQEVTLENGTAAKWISFSNHKDNLAGASAGLYFKQGDIFVYIKENSSEFDPKIEKIGSNLIPLN